MRAFPFNFSSLLPSVLLLLLPLSFTGMAQPGNQQGVAPPTSRKVNLDAGRANAHRNPEWASIEKHLPDVVSSTAATLELQADILRARRFPEDALDFYEYALKRGADAETIYKKMGVTHLELHNTALAQLYFQRAVKLNKQDAEAWNNLGAVQYLNHDFDSAVSDYKHSVKLDKGAAVYHSNLGMAYFDLRNYKKARKEIATALRIDPEIFQKTSSTGVSAHVLSPQDRARFCLEMAKNYAEQGNIEEMLHSLSMASEAGMDLSAEMLKDKTLAAYRSDPRVLVLVQNAKALHNQAGIPPGSAPAMHTVSTTSE